SGDSLNNPTYLERFRREAKAAARLHNTNIVPVFGVGEQDGVHYYAMQFIHGQGLDEVLREVARIRGAKAEPSSGIAHSLLTGRFEAPAGAQEAAQAETGSPALTAASSGLTTSDVHYFRSVARIGVQVAEALAHAHG